MATLLPNEDPDVRVELKKVLADPNQWLEKPNSLLGGKRPADLIGTEEEELLRDLVRQIEHGVVS